MTSFVGWGGAWGDSWGPLTVDPNAMRGAAGMSVSAVGTLTAIGDGSMVGAGGFTLSAFGTLTAEGQAQQQGGAVFQRPARFEIDRRALERAELQRQARIAAERQAEADRLARERADSEAAEYLARLAEAERVAAAFRIAARQAEQAITAAMIRPTIDVAAMDLALQALRDAAAKAKASENRKRAAMLAAVLLLES